MEVTWTFRDTGVAIRTWQNMNIGFTYYWHLEDDILFLYSYYRWGDIVNMQPDNDLKYKIEWINESTISLFNLDSNNIEPDIFFFIPPAD
jgi:hypothetical protein